MSELIDTTEMYLRTILELHEEGIEPLRARIVERLHQSGPTVSQTVALMVADGLLVRQPMADARKSGIRLTSKGKALLKRLQPHWQITFAAIAGLEAEIDFPLRAVLVAAATALDRCGFDERLAIAASTASTLDTSDAR